MKNAIVLVVLGLMIAAIPLVANESKPVTPPPKQEIALTAEQIADVNEYIVGASTSVMLHEIGHLLVHELDIPVLGKDEDAADMVAALILLNQEEQDEDRAARYLDATVTNWFLLGRGELDDLDDEAMADEHSLKRQRAFFNVCMMHGSGQARFADHAGFHGLPELRQQKCVGEYEKALSSFVRLIAPHVLDDDAEQTSLALYEYGETEKYAEIAELLKNGSFLEELAASVFEEIDMPRDVFFLATECGLVNAFYAPDLGEALPDTAGVIFCYELAHRVGQLYAEAFYGTDAISRDTPFTELAEAVEAGELDDDAHDRGEFALPAQASGFLDFLRPSPCLRDPSLCRVRRH